MKRLTTSVCMAVLLVSCPSNRPETTRGGGSARMPERLLPPSVPRGWIVRRVHDAALAVAMPEPWKFTPEPEPRLIEPRLRFVAGTRLPPVRRAVCGEDPGSSGVILWLYETVFP